MDPVKAKITQLLEQEELTPLDYLCNKYPFDLGADAMYRMATRMHKNKKYNSSQEMAKFLAPFAYALKKNSYTKYYQLLKDDGSADVESTVESFFHPAHLFKIFPTIPSAFSSNYSELIQNFRKRMQKEGVAIPDGSDDPAPFAKDWTPPQL